MNRTPSRGCCITAQCAPCIASSSSSSFLSSITIWWWWYANRKGDHADLLKNCDEIIMFLVVGCRCPHRRSLIEMKNLCKNYDTCVICCIASLAPYIQLYFCCVTCMRCIICHNFTLLLWLSLSAMSVNFATSRYHRWKSKKKNWSEPRRRKL